MALESKSLRIACVLLVLGWAGSSQAVFYTITGGGGQAQIGNGLPLPIQAATSSMGGPFSMTAMGAIGTGMNFPDMLLIPVNPIPAKRLVQQTAGPDPKKMTVAPGAFLRKGPGPTKVGVALNNPTVFQIQTNLQFTGPGPFDHKAGLPVNTNAVFSAGGRTGAKTVTFPGTPPTSTAKYSASAKQFGGPSTTKVVPATPLRGWAHGFMAPCKHPAFGGVDAACVSQLVAAYPGSKAVAGGPAEGTTTTVGIPAPMSPNAVVASVPLATGLVAMSASAVKTGTLTNMATSIGFPWTTGMLTLMAPAALGGPETFVITGKDARVGGVGQISLVAGALSQRKVTGANSNRAWTTYTLPEPVVALGAAAALAMLGVCHGLVRRRSR